MLQRNSLAKLPTFLVFQPKVFPQEQNNYFPTINQANGYANST